MGRPVGTSIAACCPPRHLALGLARRQRGPWPWATGGRAWRLSESPCPVDVVLRARRVDEIIE